MKKLLIICLLLVNYLAFGQKKESKFETIKNPLGRGDINGISIKTDFGKCIITKVDSALYLIYKTSAFMQVMTATNIDVSIKLEKADFEFDDNMNLSLKIDGKATAENRQVLKPSISNPTFIFELTKDMREELNKTNRVYIKLYGERGTEGGVVISKRDLKKILAAIESV